MNSLYLLILLLCFYEISTYNIIQTNMKRINLNIEDEDSSSLENSEENLTNKKV